MKLLSLHIQNFRSIAELSINPKGRNVSIFGQNGAGKTTVEDAFLWLLFGKDSSDRKDYDLIPHKRGEAVPDIGCNREPTVEASMEYFGKTVKLKKTYTEEWPKKGEFKGQYTGSKVHYFTDDMEVKAGEYQKAVSDLVDDRLFKLITNPLYFCGSLGWQERRDTLVKIAGELNVDPSPALAELMRDRPFPSFYALAKQQAKAKQKELDGLPYAISEARRLVPVDIAQSLDVDTLQMQKAGLEDRLQTLKNDYVTNTIRRRLAEIETQISEARLEYFAKIDAENKKINDGIRMLNSQLAENRSAFDFAASSIRSLEFEIQDLQKLKSRKLAEWHEANDRKWTGSEICPTCGQSLPADQVESARLAFNRQRSEDLERLKSEGIALRSQIEEKQSALEKQKLAYDSLSSEIEVLAGRIEKGKSMVKPHDFESTAEYRSLKLSADGLKDAIESGADTERQKNIDACMAEIQLIDSKLEEAGRIKLLIEQKSKQEKRVAELMDREKAINAELCTWEKAVNLCEQHVKAQSKALEAAVNGKFKIARFRLFQMQKNGEEAECCDVIYPNGSTNLSTGERLQTGVDIINTLSGYYGVTAPIWIDNAEGVTLPVETEAQVIRLIVSEADKTLRVEVDA